MLKIYRWVLEHTRVDDHYVWYFRTFSIPGAVKFIRKMARNTK
jgi:hypothetical protein